MKSATSKRTVSIAPQPYCDFSCPNADFGDPCTTGACRRDITVYCIALKRIHTKHARCLLEPPQATREKEGQ